MNIFFTSYNPHECAHHLDDKRLNKMIVETAQILSTVGRLKLPSEQCDFMHLYKATHVNHPCVRWAVQSIDNFTFLEKLLLAYLDEYKFRFGKTHACYRLLLAANAASMAIWPSVRAWEIKPQSEPPHCFHPLVDRTLPVTTGYQQTLRLKWLNDIREPKWTNREKPCFADILP